MTIKDLSAQTGYSVGTVSRVLNNQPNVSEKAKKAILEAAEASGFQLNLCFCQGNLLAAAGENTPVQCQLCSKFRKFQQQRPAGKFRTADLYKTALQ